MPPPLGQAMHSVAPKLATAEPGAQSLPEGSHDREIFSSVWASGDWIFVGEGVAITAPTMVSAKVRDPRHTWLIIIELYWA